jgi:hypothetical protein
MKNLFFNLMLGLSFCVAHTQERFLIEETDSIQIYETYLSKNSAGNVFPTFYNNGLLYLSNFNSQYFGLYFTDLQNTSTQIKINYKFNFGATTVYNNEIYFTGTSNKADKRGYFNSTIYKGIIEDFKVSKIQILNFCDKNFSYSDPCISKDGTQMLVVSSEKNVFHILELEKTASGDWQKKSVVFISHPNFDIINPTYYNNNTIYFSSNSNDGKVVGASYTTNKNGEIVVDEILREESDFNIYKIERTSVGWGIPIKMNVFNSEFDEMGVIFDSEKSGYLTSFRYNSTDNIYYFILKQ